MFVQLAACNSTYLMCARAFAQLPRVSREASATEAKNSALSLPYCTAALLPHSKLKRKTDDLLAAVFRALHPPMLLLRVLRLRLSDAGIVSNPCFVSSFIVSLSLFQFSFEMLKHLFSSAQRVAAVSTILSGR